MSVITTVAGIVVALSALLCVVGAIFAVRDTLVNDAILGVSLLIELGLIIMLVLGLAGGSTISDGAERATFFAYLVTLPLIPVGTVFLTIKEKSRWAMGALSVGGFAVAVMSARLMQIWHANA